MKVRIVPSAHADFRSIFTYISRDSPAHARRTITRIVEIVDDLSHHPQAGRVVPEYGDPNLRERRHKSYRIIYRIRGDVAEVISIFHTSRLLR
jgi:toxin ParE1/3/4